MNDDQSRSDAGGVAAAVVDPDGVGGRQDEPPPPLEGGGYQDTGGFSKFRAGDLRIEDLKKMGLPDKYVRLAQEIGVDAYLALWSRVGTDDAFLNRHGYIELKMRPFRSFLRYQRNRHIKALAAAGMRAEAIRKQVQIDLCERLSKRHILRVMAKK